MEDLIYNALAEHEYFKEFLCVVEIDKNQATIFFADGSIGMGLDIVENPAKLSKALDIAAEGYKKLGNENR